ncbi:MAG: STAS domain-containing protein [Planctomycetes bacterium]|nr:STAS domain-containing protein [Planctomycetota bacterium]
MDVSVIPDGDGRFVVICPEEMQWKAREDLLNALVRASAGLPVRGVILDMGNVASISSAGLGGIFMLRKHVVSLGGHMVVARPSISIQRLLTTINLEALMPVVPSLGEARQRLNDVISKPT